MAALLLTLCACDETRTPAVESSTPPVVETPTPAIAENDDCSDQERVIGDERARPAPPVNGDVDGDGQNDLVYLAMDEGAERGCRAFVVAELQRAGGAAVLVSEPVWSEGSRGTLPQPSINKIVDIDRDGDAEVIVDELAGASTNFVGAFTFVDGELHRIAPRDPDEEIWSGVGDFLFAYLGSVGHLDAADCADEHDVVVSSALPTEGKRLRYEVERRFFDLEGAELLPRGVETITATADEVFDELPEFRAAPFGSCPS